MLILDVEPCRVAEDDMLRPEMLHGRVDMVPHNEPHQLALVPFDPFVLL